MSYTTAELQGYFIKFHSELIDGETFRTHPKKMDAYYIKAQLRYKETDQEKQLKFARNFYDLVMNHEFTKVLFIDEMSISTSAHNGTGDIRLKAHCQRSQTHQNKGKLLRCGRGSGWKSDRDCKEKHKRGLRKGASGETCVCDYCKELDPTFVPTPVTQSRPLTSEREIPHRSRVGECHLCQHVQDFVPHTG